MKLNPIVISFLAWLLVVVLGEILIDHMDKLFFSQTVGYFIVISFAAELGFVMYVFRCLPIKGKLILAGATLVIMLINGGACIFYITHILNEIAGRYRIAAQIGYALLSAAFAFIIFPLYILFVFKKMPARFRHYRTLESII